MRQEAISGKFGAGVAASAGFAAEATDAILDSAAADTAAYAPTQVPPSNEEAANVPEAISTTDPADGGTPIQDVLPGIGVGGMHFDSAIVWMSDGHVGEANAGSFPDAPAENPIAGVTDAGANPLSFQDPISGPVNLDTGVSSDAAALGGAGAWLSDDGASDSSSEPSDLSLYAGSASFIGSLFHVTPASPASASILTYMGDTGDGLGLIATTNGSPLDVTPSGLPSSPILVPSTAGEGLSPVAMSSVTGQGTGTVTSGGADFQTGAAGSGLVININWDSSVANAPSAFKTAVESVVSFYESQFSNPVTITIDVGYGEVDGQSLGGGALGESIAFLTSVSYSALRSALVNNANAIGDSAAAASLPATSPVSGANYVLTTAEAEALGLAGSSGINGYVGFSNSFAFAYDNSGGVPAGEYDFFGVVAHEISEVMGRSMMDGPSYEPLDLFHYSAPGVRDFSGTTPGYFSPDGGITNLNNFNTNPGGDFGDWAASAGDDSYLAFSSSGVVNAVSAADLTEMNLLGWGQGSSVTVPTITSVTESPSNGDLGVGKTVTFSLIISEAVNVTGTPTLALNDGGTASYAQGSGTNTLTFTYTVAAGQNIASLAATTLNLNSATITDGAGHAVTSQSLSGFAQTGPQIDTMTPIVTALAESPSTGDLGVGKTVTFSLTISEIVNVTGSPTLALNDGGTATYVSGSGTNTLTFTYTVVAGQNIASLAATTLNLNSATVTDGAGNAATNQSLSGLAQSGPQINTGTPSITAITESPASGDLGVSNTVTFSLTMSEMVNVTGTPTLALNDGGTATYTQGSSTNTLIFTYTVAAGQNIASLAATTLNLNSATITDGAGNAVTNQSLSGLTQIGPQIDTAPQAGIQISQINDIYEAALQRAPTSAEVTAALSLGSTFGSEGIVAAVVDSSEAMTNVYPILQMFDLAFGHFPSASTLASMVDSALTLPDLAAAVVGSQTFANTYNGGTLIDPNSPVTAGIVEALYSQALGHPPSQATLNDWLNSGLSVAQAFQAMVTSPSYLATTQLAIEQYLTTAANNSAGFANSTITATAADLAPTQVDTIYEAVLQRAPTPTEVTASLALDSATGNAGAIAALVNSPEAVANVYPILQMFNLAFGYFPGAATLASMVDSALTLPELAAAVVASQTFANTYSGGTLIDPNSPVTAGIVEALYTQALGHPPSQATLNDWLSSGLTVAEAFQDMVTSESYFETTQLAIEQYLTAAAINQAGLTTVNGTDATGGLDLGLTPSSLTVLGGSGALTVVASGSGDTITELNTSTAGGTITANGAGDTINAANGANTITANGGGDHINLGVVATGTSITAAQIIHTAGAGDTITFATTAGDSTAVIWGTGASSTVDGGNNTTGIGANSTVNFGNNTGSGSETVVLTGDLGGATTSGGTSTSGIAMTTLGNVHDGAGDLIVFNNATTEILAGTSAVNVSSATSLAHALDLAAASAASSQGGTIAGHSGVIDWFHYAGSTYVVEAINGGATAATHNALAATDEVLKIVGLVSLTAESLSLHTLTL